MAQVLSIGGSANTEPFIPNISHVPPLRYLRSPSTYPRYLMKAPYIATEDSAIQEEVKVPCSRRCRLRKQAGLTNRWQLPDQLGSDFLGKSQAFKAVRAGVVNDSLKRIMTADFPLYVHEEVFCDPVPRPAVPSCGSTAPRSTKQCVRLPGSARPITPEDLFHYHSRRVAQKIDVVLECLGSFWELHSPYLTKSRVLTELFTSANKQTGKTVSNSPDYHYFSSSDKPHSKCASPLSQRSSRGRYKANSGRQLHQTRRPVVLKLNIQDPDITRDALAVALQNLYFSKPEVEVREAAGVLAAAAELAFQALFQGCISLMMSSISTSTVCQFHYMACKYREEALLTACERWLELNLVPQLQSGIHLRNLPHDLLQKLLKSTRLFTFSEYHLYRTVLYWVFLQLNPTVQIMPSHSSILTYFISLPKKSALLERDVGQKYVALFQSLRLHGITANTHLEEIQQINVLPQASLLRLFTKHYYALQSGGDVPYFTDFSSQAMRFGLLIDREPQYRTETISLYGFFFELKAARHGESATYSFSMKRLKYNDPALSFRACERHPFSLLQGREIRYEIKVQSTVEEKWQIFSTGVLSKEFGVTKKSAKSQIFTVKGLSLPIYVTFGLVFPSF
ncbi:BTB/POZ domain-containing protein 16 isoform X1 [Huso huso]|uniref:BTB/POZ domain-containing protein 16 n=1 Tax=Huso huso TaxID=61971 RepID=A0ABR0ZBM1_HUSHU